MRVPARIRVLGGASVFGDAGPAGLPSRRERTSFAGRGDGSALADLAARIYLKRCANYMINGVPPDWTGVETLTEK